MDEAVDGDPVAHALKLHHVALVEGQAHAADVDTVRILDLKDGQNS